MKSQSAAILLAKEESRFRGSSCRSENISIAFEGEIAHVYPSILRRARSSIDAPRLSRVIDFPRRSGMRRGSSDEALPKIASVGTLGSEALEVHVVSIHVVLQQLGEIPAQGLEFRPAVGIGVPTARYHPEELATAVRRPLQPITVVHVPHDFPRRHIRVRC